VVLQAQFQAVGMNVRVRTLESAALQKTWDGGEFAFFLSGLSPRPDAEIYYCQFWRARARRPVTRMPNTTVCAAQLEYPQGG